MNRADIRFASVRGALIILAMSPPLQAESWEPVVGADELREAFVNVAMEAEMRSGSKAVARYFPDGTGELTFQGVTYPREWKVEGEDLICWNIDDLWQCARIERNKDNPNEYREINLTTGQTTIFTVSDQIAQTKTSQLATGGKGGAAQPSNAELAAKLANPTAPVMTIGNNFDYVLFDGDAPGADEQSAFRYTFQTVFPYKLSGDNGTIFFRPAIPVLFSEPVPDGLGAFDSKGVDIGDMIFDLSWGTTTKSGLIWGGGMVGTIPTSTDDALGKDQWALGPELLLGAIGKWGVVTGILSHQWDVAGGDSGVKTNITTLNYVYAFPLGNGWQFFSAPVITYDHERPEDKLTFPVGIGLSKTAVFRGRPWKLQIQYWNYVEGSSTFSPEHLIRVSINPVLEAKWNRGR
jgi:hypothetical protein